MGWKSRRPANGGELKELQRLKYENQKLRKQISSLRKQLSRIDIDRYSNLKELVESQDKQDKQFDKKLELKKLKDKWICWECGRDHLRLIIIPRLDGTFYLRRCPTCSHKTKMKKYVDGIEGITDDKEAMAKD